MLDIRGLPNKQVPSCQRLEVIKDCGFASGRDQTLSWIKSNIELTVATNGGNKVW
ncbi:hypothetical protein HanPSC8_Chr15g0653811 [Helianthus annuus]|nr:hypothetical protein HanPSC8_Chr15g0653811 [Helianthus annuus]